MRRRFLRDLALPAGLRRPVAVLGPVLLLLFAAGLAVFAAFCLFDARYRTE